MIAELRTNETDWYPNSVQQTRFLSSPAFEALFGGQAGPGKTECLVRELLRQVWHPKYTGILFRRTFPMLEMARGVIQRSLECYPTYGGKYNDQKHYWKFPSGARIYFGHMQHPNDMTMYQSAEFTCVFFDELTEFEQQQYLYMFTRCRTSYPDLRAYMRSATNPGGIGHFWVKKRFITRNIRNQSKYFATVENEDTEVARDHRDRNGELDALSRAFYPAKLEDNPNRDPEYAKRIKASGDPVRIAQLLGGDWDAEYRDGLIYGTWKTDINVSDSAEYNPDLPVYWACDDGYVYGDGPGSVTYHPRVVLFVQDNALGGLNVFDEYLATEETHAETLTHVAGHRDNSEPDTPTRWQAYRRPSVAYIPAEASIFRGEISKWGFSSVNGTHRVSEGIKAVREHLHSLRVHPRCQALIYEFGVYRSDPKGRADQGEIVPLKMDDHSCLARGTLIFTDRGNIPIQEIKTGDQVWTRGGRKPVSWSGQTGIKPVLEALLSDGTTLIGTADHPVFVAQKGFVRLDTLRYGDIITHIAEYQEIAQWQTLKPLFTRVSNSAATLIRPTGQIDLITALIQDISGTVCKRYTEKFGTIITALFQRVATYIIKMATRSTTTYPTSNVSLKSITFAGTAQTEALNGWNTRASTWTKFVRLPQNGMAPKWGANGIGSTASNHGKIAKPNQSCVITASNLIWGFLAHAIPSTFVQMPVKPNRERQARWTTKAASVFSVGRNSQSISTPKLNAVHVVAVRCGADGDKPVPVYNLKVEGAHEYFANGVLVHNCDALRYIIFKRRHKIGDS